MELYLVGQIRVDAQWEFQGIFENEKLAADACRNRNYFYMKIMLNKQFLDDTTIMVDCKFPK